MAEQVRDPWRYTWRWSDRVASTVFVGHVPLDPDARELMRDVVSEERFRELTEGVPPTAAEERRWLERCAAGAGDGGGLVSIIRVREDDDREVFLVACTDADGHEVFDVDGPFDTFADASESVKERGEIAGWTKAGEREQ